jgi:xanthine dehydrogenase YagS FAD-binding subunit
VLDVAGPGGNRAVAIDRFFTLPKDNLRRENVLSDGEFITGITVPASAVALRSTYLKFKERASLDFAMSSVAAAVELGPDRTVKTARLVLGGVAPVPWHVPMAEAFLEGKTLDEATVAQAAAIAVQGAQPLAQNGYKVPLTHTLVRRALLKLVA